MKSIQRVKTEVLIQRLTSIKHRLINSNRDTSAYVISTALWDFFETQYDTIIRIRPSKNATKMKIKDTEDTSAFPFTQLLVIGSAEYCLGHANKH